MLAAWHSLSGGSVTRREIRSRTPSMGALGRIAWAIVHSSEDAANDRSNRNNTINYLLRTAQQSNVQLSAMADQKASIALGATFVMATVAAGDLLGDGDPAPALVVLAVASVVAGIFAILALIPKIGAPEGAANPLFFGHVALFTAEEYHERMAEVLADPDTAHRAIIEDFRRSSVVLLRSKYRWLRFSYLTLLVGMLATAATAIVA